VLCTVMLLGEAMYKLSVEVDGWRSCWEDDVHLSCDHSRSARAERTLFLTKSARTLTHFIMRTHFTFFLRFSLFHSRK